MKKKYSSGYVLFQIFHFETFAFPISFLLEIVASNSKSDF